MRRPLPQRRHVARRAGRVRPQEVAAHVLRFLLAAAEADLGAPVTKAVISVSTRRHPAARRWLRSSICTVSLAVRKTVDREVTGRRSGFAAQVPAYFDPEQRETTIAAGRLAGLETVRLVRWRPCTLSP